MVNDVLNHALFHFSLRISQTLHQILHVLHFCALNSLLNYAPVFVVNNFIDIRTVRLPQIWKFIGVTMVSDIIALLEWRQRMIPTLIE